MREVGAQQFYSKILGDSNSHELKYLNLVQIIHYKIPFSIG